MLQKKYKARPDNEQCAMRNANHMMNTSANELALGKLEEFLKKEIYF